MLATDDFRKLLLAFDLLKEVGDDIEATCKCRVCLLRRGTLLEARKLILKLSENADEQHQEDLPKVN
jgi:hypothetical protein